MSNIKFTMRDSGLQRAFAEMQNNTEITQNDVDKLLDAANDGGRITDLEKNELNWLLYKHSDKFTGDAKQKMASALGFSSGESIPMPSVYIRDNKLSAAVGEALADENVSRGDLQKIIDAANDGGSITRHERGELLMVLNRVGDKMDAGARAELAQTLGVEIPQETAPLKDVSDLRGNVYDIKDLASFNEARRTDLGAARDELVGHPSLSDDQKADRMFEFFKPYGKRFATLAEKEGAQTGKAARAEVLSTLKEVGFDAMLTKDSDKDGLNAATEIMRGTNPEQFTMIADAKTWTTTYWPMAGNSRNPDGDVKSNLWASGGALDKLDQLSNARGNESGAKALEFERKPALNWLIGENNNKGHYIPDSKLKETDAEVTTGVDFDGDGRITSGVKADFLDAQGNFAATNSRHSFVPKLGDEVLTRKMEDVDGQKVVNYFKQDGTKLTTEEKREVILTNARSDGKASETMDVGWWGSCDKVALAGILFEDPKRDVTLDGVTFTKQDIRGLLTVVADSQSIGSDFVGNRYDNKPDILVTKDGRQISGKLETNDVEFRTNDMWRWSGDYMVLNEVDKEVKFRDFATGEVETFNASDIKHLAREDKKDMEPSLWADTLEEWLGSGRAMANDHDSGDHVWNSNIWKAERAEIDAPYNTNVEELRGHHGEINNPDNVKFFETDVYMDGSDWPKTYRYWVETDPSSGKAVNSGWISKNPDFLWRPKGFNNWAGTNSRNPYVTPSLVKEIYEASIK